MIMQDVGIDEVSENRIYQMHCVGHLSGFLKQRSISDPYQKELTLNISIIGIIWVYNW